MTQKDYVKIAAALDKSRPRITGQIRGEYRSQWSIDVATIADMLALDNPRFNRARFYAACGVQS